jgi:hypothetical protein
MSATLSTLELDVIAACLIGGASAYSGVGLAGAAAVGDQWPGVGSARVCIDVYNQRRHFHYGSNRQRPYRAPA